MRILNFGIKVAFRTAAIIIGILMIVGYSVKTIDGKTKQKVDTSVYAQEDTDSLKIKETFYDVVDIFDEIVETDEYKNVEKNAIDKYENVTEIIKN
jgi:uncharacterized membrane protein YraQ (UPF0718 family)